MPASVNVAVDVGEHGQGLFRALLRLSGPSVFAGLLKSTFALADTWCAGQVSTNALAALSASVFFLWMFHSLSYSVSVGALSAAAQAKGAQDDAEVRAVQRRCVTLALGLGALSSVVLLIGSRLALGHMNLSEPVHEAAASYLVVLCVAGPAWWLFDTLEQSFRAVGDARTPLAVVGAVAALNLGLNPLLALGAGPIEGLGVTGIALATAITWALGAGALWLLARHRGLLAPTTAHAPSARSILVVGAPTALASIGFDLIYLVLTPLIALGGPAALAAISVGHRLEGVSYLCSQGIAQATSAIVGQAIGDERPHIARRATALAGTSVITLAGAWAAVLLVFGRELYGLFSSDPAVFEVGRDYLALCAIPLVMQAVEGVTLGAFAGAGQVLLPSAITLGVYAVRIPLGYWLAQEYGVVGVFMAIAATALGAGVLVISAFIWVGPGRRKR